MNVKILIGDCRDVLRRLPDASVQCCVTSPPYFGLRDYGVAGQIGLEPTPDAFVAEMVAVFREVRRVLRDDGTLWLNLGDSYSTGPSGKTREDPFKASGLSGGLNNNRAARSASQMRPKSLSGLKPKDLIGIPWRVAFALQADGWYLRQDIIWHKPNPMPESVKDRCTKAHEYIFMLSKSPRYYWDAEAVKEEAQHPERRHKSSNKSAAQESAFFGNAPTNFGRCGTSEDGKRNRRSVWTVSTQPFKGSHFATFPPALIEPCIKAGCPAGGTVLDPFGGAGTTGLVADRLQRHAVLIELNPEYAAMAERRIAREGGLFADVGVSQRGAVA